MVYKYKMIFQKKKKNESLHNQYAIVLRILNTYILR